MVCLAILFLNFANDCCVSISGIYWPGSMHLKLSDCRGAGHHDMTHLIAILAGPVTADHSETSAFKVSSPCRGAFQKFLCNVVSRDTGQPMT